MARAQLFHDASASASSPCSLQDLRFTITELLTPLQKLLTATAHNAVFANLQQIAELHARLEDELQEAKRVPKKEKGEKNAMDASQQEMLWAASESAVGEKF